MKKILFATDFSQSCENARNYLMNFVAGTDTKVDMIHIFSIPVSTITGTEHTDIGPVIEAQKKNLKQLLVHELSAFPVENQGDVHLIYGIFPSSDIADKADEVEADLIVTALRQKYSLLDRMIGTVTANTMSKANVPVLAIPNQAKFEGIISILFPTKFESTSEISESEKASIQWLQKIEEYHKNPKIHLVHIAKDEGMNVSFLNSPIENVKFTISHAPSVGAGVQQFVQNEEPDIIAFFKSNRRLWERLYSSSLTRKLLFKSRIPILVF